MKKYIKIMTLIFFLLFFANTVNAAGKTTFYISDVTKYSNSDKVTLELCVKNVNKKMNSWSLDVKYDPSKLEFVNSKAGKDLKATIKLAENIKEENRVAVGAVSLTGFDKDGVYYYIMFKVKDQTSDIPVELNVREVCDSNGNDIKFDFQNAKIIIDKENKTENKEEKNITQIQELKPFQETDVQELESLENILINTGSIVIGPEDELVYETEHLNVVEILDDGTMIPKENGTTTVRVKCNGLLLGTVEIQVLDNRIAKIYKIENNERFIPEATTDETTTIEEVVEEYKTYYYKLEREAFSKKFYAAIMIVAVITILLRIFLIIRKNRGGKL